MTQEIVMDFFNSLTTYQKENIYYSIEELARQTKTKCSSIRNYCKRLHKYGFLNKIIVKTNKASINCYKLIISYDNQL